MCVVSMVSDHYIDKWTPYVQPWNGGIPNIPFVPIPTAIPNNRPGDSIPWEQTIHAKPGLTQEEIDQFRRDAEELKKLLKRAREYDTRNNEPECELESKRKTLKLIAAALGVDVSFI
jgi:hypothetical protein